MNPIEPQCQHRLAVQIEAGNYKCTSGYHTGHQGMNLTQRDVTKVDRAGLMQATEGRYKSSA